MPNYRERPIRPSNSIGLIDGRAGTLCMLVQRNAVNDSNIYGLSCEHVLHPQNRPRNARVVQPAMQDTLGSGYNNVIGTEVFAGGLQYDSANSVDAALVRIESNVSQQNFLADSFVTTPMSKTDYTVGSSVTMLGRSSGESHGRILGKAASCLISYAHGGWTRPILFADILECDYESAGGDSGAPIVHDASGAVIGMHIGENDGINRAYACHIIDIFAHFDIRPI